jgi:hypothetical protein
VSKRFAALTLAAASAVVGVVLPLGATAWAYPPENPVVQVSNPRPVVGGTTQVNYDGCLPGDSATFILDGFATTVTVPESGIATVTVDVPDTAGMYTGSVECTSGNSDTFVVDVQSLTPMPTTGADAFGTGARLGVAALAVGAGLVIVSRRRRSVAS